MADYSDSENESEVEFTTTSVLLGYVLEDEAAAEDTISHIGGIPVCTTLFLSISLVLGLCKMLNINMFTF